jgi:hypothetical protein
MPSFNAINYSLRPSKTIQRSLVFEGIQRLQSKLNLEKMLYVGFGSIWFTDFQIAHKNLHIVDMISMESNEIGFWRAEFNRPFNTVTVMPGLSNEVLPKLYEEEKFQLRPWLLWLDYDRPLEEASVDDIRRAIENAPPDSILLATFNARARAYGEARGRPERLKSLLGAVVPDELGKDQCTDELLPGTLADLTTNFMLSVAAEAARPGRFLPAFRIVYADTTVMVTVGGILPAKGAVPAARAAIAEPEWPCLVPNQIMAPHLTLKEVSALYSKLPNATPLTRDTVLELGFDLEEDQISTFERYYRYYPNYAQIAI